MPNFHNRSVDTLEAIAVAIALFEQHNHQVINFSKKGPKSTKTLMLEHFMFPDRKVDNLNYEAAEELRKILSHSVLMSKLSTKSVPDFYTKLHELLVPDTVKLRDMGMIAWSPHICKRITKQHRSDEILTQYQYTSRHFGVVNSKVTLKLTIVEQQYIAHFNTHRYKGYTEQNNIVMFYSKKNFSGIIDVTAKIRCLLDDGATKITQLNYVKECK